MLDNCLYVFQLIIKFKSKRSPSSVTKVRPLFSLSPRGSDNSPLLILIMFRYNSLYDTKDKHSNHDLIMYNYVGYVTRNKNQCTNAERKNNEFF